MCSMAHLQDQAAYATLCDVEGQLQVLEGLHLEPDVFEGQACAPSCMEQDMGSSFSKHWHVQDLCAASQLRCLTAPEADTELVLPDIQKWPTKRVMTSPTHSSNMLYLASSDVCAQAFYRHVVVT